MAVDRGQQVVEVVGDAAGELAHRLHLLALDELRLQRLELGGVGEDREQRGRAVEHGAGEGDLQEDLLAVGGAAGDLGAAEGAAAGGVGQPFGDRAAEALEQLGDVDARAGALAEQLPRRLVGVGERAAGLEPRQRHRQLLEEVIGHQARDLGVVQRHQQQVAAAVGIGEHDRPHRPAAAGKHVHAVGAERQVGQDLVEIGPVPDQGGRGGVGLEHPALGVDPQPGHPGRGEAGPGLGSCGAALDAPEQGPRTHPADDDAVAPVGGILDRHAVQPGLAGQPVAQAARLGGGGLEHVGDAGGRVAAQHPAGEIADEDRFGMALEVADAAVAIGRGAAQEADPERQKVGAEHQQRHRERSRDDGRPAPDPGQRRAQEQRPGRGQSGAGPEVAARQHRLRLALVSHRPHVLWSRASLDQTRPFNHRYYEQAVNAPRVASQPGRGARKRAMKKPSPPSSGLSLRLPSGRQPGCRSAKAAARASFSRASSEQVA